MPSWQLRKRLVHPQFELDDVLAQAQCLNPTDSIAPQAAAPPLADDIGHSGARVRREIPLVEEVASARSFLVFAEGD